MPINENQANGKQKEDLDKILRELRVDTSKEIIRKPCILSIEEIKTTVVKKRILTAGNISCITGKQKSRKSFLAGMFASYVIKGTDNFCKLIGVMQPGKKYVVYVDTEQGDEDSQNLMRRIENMSGDKKKFIGFNMREKSPAERVKYIEHIFVKFGNEVCLLVVDGIADLLRSNNDEEQAKEIVTLQMKWTKQYDAHVLNVLHQNKQDNFATGWIGSEILKKSEIIISVKKIQDRDISEVTCTDSRSREFDPFILGVNEHGYPYIMGKHDGKAPPNYTEPKKPDDVFDEEPAPPPF